MDITEGQHIERLHAMRPSALRKGGFSTAVRKRYTPPIEDALWHFEQTEDYFELLEANGGDVPNGLCVGLPWWHDEFFANMPPRIVPDAYELFDDCLVVYEVDGTHRTQLSKMINLANWAEAILGLGKLQLQRGSPPRRFMVHLWIYDVRSDVTRWFDAMDLSNAWRQDLTEEEEDRSIPAATPYCTQRVPGMCVDMLPVLPCDKQLQLGLEWPQLT